MTEISFRWIPAAEATSDRLRGPLEAAEHRDGAPPVSDQALLAAARGRRAVLAVTAGPGLPDPAALGIVGEGELDLVVHPEARGRGIGGRTLAALLDRHSAQSPGPDRVRAWAHGENPAATALLRRAGFTPVRSLLRLSLDPARLPDADPQGSSALPGGLRLRAFDPEDAALAREWVRVNAAAFAGHPEQGRLTLVDFETLAAEPWFDPGDLLLAIGPEGRLSGFAWVKTRSEGERGDTVHCELYVLGVDPAAAGQGLGGGLLQAALARMAEHRPQRVTLHVDGDNTGARRLYERAGFALEATSTQWLRDRSAPLDGEIENAR